MMKSFEKYLFIINASIQRGVAYRFNTLMMMLSSFVSFGILFYFWSSAYSNGGQIGNYTFSGIVSYYIFASIFRLIIQGDSTGWDLGYEIQNGKITAHILKPVSFIMMRFSQSVGNLMHRMMIYLLGILVLFYLLRNYLVFSIGIEKYLLFSISLILGFLLFFLFFYLVGLGSFWFGSSEGLNYMGFTVINFMQGGVVPLDLLPTWIVKASHYLPFEYTFFIPIEIIAQNYTLNPIMLLVPLGWILVLFFVARILFKRGLIKYESYGA